ncbi:MAG: DMT family transporter [Candidatus Staskawiczbacteria bacterium]|nr:DMT family transporter [Candidatus Staskawiczbacteria bacterium]
MILSWLLVIILAYLFFSLAYLGDKLVLAGPPKAISYTFYVGMMNAFALLLLPFTRLTLPSNLFGWVIADAIVFVLGLYFMFSAVEKFEVSKVMTTVGAVQPIFVFILAWLFWGPQVLEKADVLAFSMLLLGSILISMEKEFKSSLGYIKMTLIAALMFSFDYIFSKVVYLSVPFLAGLFWMKFLVFIFVLPLLLFKKNRRDIFNKQNIMGKKTKGLFVFAQSAGGIANILQAFAISLAPVAVLPIVNSLRGVQYIFLFLITLFISAFFPKILKEEISSSIIIRKIVSIILIVAGLAILIAY